MAARRSVAVASLLLAGAVALVTVGFPGTAAAAFASLAATRGLQISGQGHAFCGSTDGASAASTRSSLVVMQSQGQGGRFNYGQKGQVTLKGAKKRAVTRPRKNYGSHGARKVPRRYPIYDILEDLDSKIPTYTVVSEPEEPMVALRDLPLLERYPWAGSLEKVPQAKQDIENSDEKMEPYFGDFTREIMPPQGRMQNYVHRRGYPAYHHPPWINKPIIGRAVRVPNDMPFKKDRRPLPSQYFPHQEEEKRARFGDLVEEDE